MHPTIRFGSISIPTYGLIAVIGFFIALLVYIHIAKRYQIAKDDIIFASIFGAIGLLIGSKVLFFITLLPNAISHFDQFMKHPFTNLSYMFSGGVFYGGLIGGAIGIALYCRKYHISARPFANATAPAIPLFHMFGRIGCHFAGCCYGKEYHGWMHITYPILGQSSGTIDRIPVQLIEAACNFVLFVCLYLYEKKTKKSGHALGWYLVAYTTIRFILEFFRGDTYRGYFLMFSTSQWISLILFPVGIGLLMNKNGKKKTSNSEPY